MHISLASILDFPRRSLPPSLWLYETEDVVNELPILRPTLKFLILNEIEKYLSAMGLKLDASNLYGGAASYQWSPGSDIDVSVYAKGWDEKISEEEIEKCQATFKKIEILFKGFVVHLYLKSPTDKNLEVADAVYDIVNAEWVLPPLILPDNFDPDEYFKPFLRVAEKKAQNFDLAIGSLRRSWNSLLKASKASNEAKEPDLVRNRIKTEKDIIRKLVTWLGDSFIAIRDKRYAMHDALREKMADNVEVGRFERFQEPEIIWKALDRAGYNDFLWKLYKLKQDDKLEKILAKY